MTAHLRLDQVGKVFGGRGRDDAYVAFDRITIDVAPSEFVAIVRPSGCGKSTLLRIAAGLIDATQGTVTLDGAPIHSPPPGVVYLFQQYAKSLFAWRTILDNVRFPLEAMGRGSRAEQRARARDLLAQVGLAGFEDRYPWQLSGGMQQRVAIARALAAEPRVLLLDEPFSAVDALTRLDLQALVLDLWTQNRFTAVLVTHDVDEAVFMADRVAILSQRPTTIADMVEVGLARPRDPIETRERPRFLELRHQLTSMLLGRAAPAHA